MFFIHSLLLTLSPDPRTSEAAKEKARNILEGNADPSDYKGTGTHDERHGNRVTGGYKATLSSQSPILTLRFVRTYSFLFPSDPNTSEEAKAKARGVLGGQDEEEIEEFAESTTQNDAHTNRILGGFKVSDIHVPCLPCHSLRHL